MGYKVLNIPMDGCEERKGLEGPFRYASGHVLYYDPSEGKYWDPNTDWYLDHDQALAIVNGSV